jgi:hypothetical protein
MMKTCSQLHNTKFHKIIETSSCKTNLGRTADTRINPLECPKIDTLTDSGIYIRPPPRASQMMIVLGITLHTAARNPGVRVNMDIHLCEGRLGRRTVQGKDQGIEPSRV